MTFAITPLVAHSLGKVGYGLWAVGFTFTSFLTVADFGMNAGLVRMVGHSKARGEIDQVRQYVLIALGFYVLLGFLLLGATWLLSPSLVALLQVPTSLRPEAMIFLIGATAFLGVNNIAGVFTSMFNGLEAIHISSLFTLGAGVLNGLTIAIALIVFHFNMVGLIYACALVAALWTVVMAVVGSRRIGGVFRTTGPVGRERLKQLASFSLGMQVSNVAGVINFSLDRFVLAAIVGLTSAGLYDLGSRLTLVIWVLTGLIGGAGFPTAVRLNYVSAEDFQRFCKQVDAFLILTSCGLGGLLVAVSGPLVDGWLGPDYDGVVVATRFLAVSAAGLGLYAGPSMALWALGRIKEVTIFNLVRTGLHIALSVVLTWRFGLLGTLSGALIALVSSSLWFSLATRSLLGESKWLWLTSRLGRPLAAAFLSAALVLVLSSLPTVAQVSSSTRLAAWVSAVLAGAVFTTSYVGLLALLGVFSLSQLRRTVGIATSG